MKWMKQGPGLTEGDLLEAKVLGDNEIKLDVFEQQAGVGVDPRRRRRFGEEFADQDVPTKVRDWVEPDDLPVRVEAENPVLSVAGMLELRGKMQKAIDEWMNQGSEERVSLQELMAKNPLEPDSLAFQAFLHRGKVKRLLELDSVKSNKPLEQTLKTVAGFIDRRLVPSLKLDKETVESIEQSVNTALDTPRERGRHDGKNYQERAEAVLSEGEFEKQEKKRNKLLGMAKYGAIQETPVKMYEDLLESASQVNMVRLCEVLEAEGIDLQETKSKIAELMTRLPERAVVEGVGGEGLADDYEIWLQELLGLVAPVTNTIRKKYKHDDVVYLMSQVLASKKASCAGKALMGARLLEQLGLETVYENVDIRLDSSFEGSHVEMGLRLPGGIYVQLDMNASQFQERGWLTGLFAHNVAILHVTGREVSGQERSGIAGAQRPRKVVVNGEEAWVLAGVAHKMVNFGKKLPNFDEISLANLLQNHPELFGNKEALRESERLFRQAIKKNPEFAMAMFNLAILLQNHPELFGNKEALKESERLYRQAIEKNPEYVMVMNNLAILLRKHPELFGGEEALKEAERLYRQVIKKNPKSVAAMNNLAILLVDHSELFGGLKAWEEAFGFYRCAIEKGGRYREIIVQNLMIFLQKVKDNESGYDNVQVGKLATRIESFFAKFGRGWQWG